MRIRKFRKIQKTKIPRSEKFERFRKIRKTKIPKDPKIRKSEKPKIPKNEEDKRTTKNAQKGFSTKLILNKKIEYKRNQFNKLKKNTKTKQRVYKDPQLKIISHPDQQ